MASRKPKGIVDDIVGGIRDIVSPWLGTPPGQNRQVTQGKALARTAAETLDQVYAGGMIKAGTQGNAALAKQAAINAAALGAGYVAGKAIQKVVANTKVPSFDWDSKPYSVDPALRSTDRANFYWKPQTDIVNPKSPSVEYLPSIRPANPQATRYGYRSADQGYKVNVDKIDGDAFNKTMDSAKEYNKIVGIKQNDLTKMTNVPTSNQFMEDLSSGKIYKNLQKAQRAAERIVNRNIKKR